MSGGARKEKDRRKEKLEKEESGSCSGRDHKEEESRAADAPLGIFPLSPHFSEQFLFTVNINNVFFPKNQNLHLSFQGQEWKKKEGKNY